MSDVIIPSSPEDRRAIRSAVEEISNSLTRIASERDLINEILSNVEEKHEVPKKYVRQIAKMYFKQNASDVEAEFSAIETLYDHVMRTPVE